MLYVVVSISNRYCYIENNLLPNETNSVISKKIIIKLYHVIFLISLPKLLILLLLVTKKK